MDATATFTPHQNVNAKGIFHCLAHPEDYDGPRYTDDIYAIAVDALDNFHFNSTDPDHDACCSIEDPCEWAARHLLGTGRVAGARGYVHSLPFLRIAEEATGTGAPVSFRGHIQPTEEPQDQPGSGKGTGTGGGRRKTGPKPITDAQYATLMSLLDELIDLGMEEVSEETREGLKELNVKEASTVISGFLAGVKDARAKAKDARIKASKGQAAKAEQELEEGGLYRHDDKVYWIKRSKSSGYLYALRVIIDGEYAATEMAKGMVRKLDPADKLDSEEALEVASRYGKATGKCMICSRKLTKKESIARGIGPICAEKV